MGVCWGDPRYPSPTHTACLKSRMTLTISSTTSSGTSKTFPVHTQILEESDLRVFTSTELKAATQNFGRQAYLGEGGFGQVFKGLIDEKATSGSRKFFVAVKKLKKGSLQGFREWQTEIMFLGRLSHPNIAKLLGYCHEDEQLSLVYEFASKGSLDNHLYGRHHSIALPPPLPWDRRLKIALGVARGLAFLHACEQTIIHGDITPANILLDEAYTAKLSDFGLTKFGPSEGSHLSISVNGTVGYVAPEFLKTGHLYIKSDVYGFGVVLLQLLTGRRVFDATLPENERYLVKWSQLQLPRKEKLVAMMDPKLGGIYSLEGAAEVAQLALECVHAHQDQRPSMIDVMDVLERIEAASEGSNCH